MKSWLFHNLGLKIFSVILAVFFWALIRIWLGDLPANWSQSVPTTPAPSQKLEKVDIRLQK